MLGSPQPRETACPEFLRLYVRTSARDGDRLITSQHRVDRGKHADEHQFVRTDAGAVWLQMTVLGLVFVAMATIPDLAWALTGSAVRRLLPAVRMKTMERISGTVLFGLAGYALTARRAAACTPTPGLHGGRLLDFARARGPL